MLAVTRSAGVLVPSAALRNHFFPISGLAAVNETADAPHHLRISDGFGTNRAFNEGLLACPGGDPWTPTNPMGICGNWGVLGVLTSARP